MATGMYAQTPTSMGRKGTAMGMAITREKQHKHFRKLRMSLLSRLELLIKTVSTLL